MSLLQDEKDMATRNTAADRAGRRTKGPEIHDIELTLHSETSAALSCVGADGRRYHVWVTTVEPLRPTDGWLYCNAPEGLTSRDPGYFHTRQYGLGTRFKNMDAIADYMLETAKREGLLAKARKAYDDAIAAAAARSAEREREARIKEHGPELLEALQYCRDSGFLQPHRDDTEHDRDQKAQALEAIAKAEGPVMSKMLMPV